MSQIILDRQEQQYIQMLEDLNKPRGDGLKAGLNTRLHSDQIEVLKPLYQEGVKDLFLACGRKYGKTELVGYVLWRHALMNPGSACYYVAPEAAHARKLIWDNMRIQRFLGEDSAKYISTIRNQEMMIRFHNGSFIQLVGSDNYMVANGLTPHIAVYDEFKGFNPRWHIEFAPNRAAKAAPLVFIGTRPRAGNKNMDQYNEVLEYMETDAHSRVYYKTTFDNPINHLPDQKKVIDREIEQLMARGEEDVVQLEYYSKYIPGGKKAIFPQLRKDLHMFPHKDLISQVERDRKRLEWAWICDPGNVTCFGMLFAVLNRYTGTLYILDEIYETNQKDTSLGIIVPKGKMKAMELYPNSSLEDDWIKTADDQAAWFMTECMARFNIYFSPANKFVGTKEDGLSLIKDQLIYNKIKISDRCVNLYKEMEQYAKDLNGNIPKKNDHLIDCLRYLNIGVNYDFSTIHETINAKDPIREGRFRGIEHDKFESEDWLDDLAFDTDFDF